MKPASILKKHRYRITYAGFDVDNRILISTGSQNKLIAWNIENPDRPRKIVSLAVCSGLVYTAELNPSGTVLAAENGNRGTVLLNVANLPEIERLAVLPAVEPVMRLAFSHGGERLAIAEMGNRISIWDVSENSSPRRLVTMEPPTAGQLMRLEMAAAMAFSPDGSLLATTGWDSGVILWEVSDSRRPKRIASFASEYADVGVYSLSFSPDGSILGTSEILSTGGVANLWDVSDPLKVRLVSSIKRPGDTISVVAFSPRGKLLAAEGPDAGVSMWNVSDPSRPVPVDIRLGDFGFLTRASFSANSRLLVSTHAAEKPDFRLMLWNLDELFPIR
ncbi:WD40 repeat domain-containing protein [Frankia sp. R82]|uniref:WD40 repeat domain-containing protein n=1 Tax=Frankia sp. R82 TaxID=2950553 RepID=UPI002043C68A|nr:WD40 repeat domain-containing protein [Frankia sp. R82]MCM3884075.1 WD40 repeat domain-containing protein [Frankia sp. R82]